MSNTRQRLEDAANDLLLVGQKLGAILDTCEGDLTAKGRRKLESARSRTADAQFAALTASENLRRRRS